jgi:hypothetical protein
MRIDSMGSLNSAKSTQKKQKKNSDVDFSEMMTADIEGSSNVEKAQLISETNPFLALQEVYPEQQEDEELYEAGNNLLSQLHKIRLRLIDNSLSHSDLLELKQLLDAQNLTFKTQQVQNLYDDIRLRAEVELAKLEANF